MANFTGSAQVVNSYARYLGTTLNYNVDTIQVLLGTGALPVVTNEFVSQLTGTEASGGGYARQTLTTMSWAQAGSQAKLVSDPVTFTAAGGDITAAWYVLFKNTGNDATSPIIQFGWLDATGQDNKTVSPPDSIIITPDATNGWNDVSVA